MVNDLGGSTDGQGNDSRAADAVVAQIQALGGVAVANYDSVATAQGGERIIQTAMDTFGTVDIVINNAGILRDASLVKMSAENFDALIDVHLKGAFYVTQPAFRVMKEKGYGRVVYTASGAGLFGNFGQANYAAAKMGLVGLSSVTAIEGAKYNIKSNVITPIARTRLTEGVMGATGEMFAPEYIAPMVAYLVSEACEYSMRYLTSGRVVTREFLLPRPRAGMRQQEPPRLWRIYATNLPSSPVLQATKFRRTPLMPEPQRAQVILDPTTYDKKRYQG